MKKHLQKSMNIISVPSQRYQDPRHLLQNPKVLGASWASIIAHRDLVDLIIWMYTAPLNTQFSILSLYLICVMMSLCGGWSRNRNMTKNMARQNQQQLDTSPSLPAQGADVITSAQWPSPQ